MATRAEALAHMRQGGTVASESFHYRVRAGTDAIEWIATGDLSDTWTYGGFYGRGDDVFELLPIVGPVDLLTPEERRVVAEYTKARELPADVRRHVEVTRSHALISPGGQALVAWFDAHYPKPKTQAELDAEHLERLARDHDHYNPNELRGIARRLRGGK